MNMWACLAEALGAVPPGFPEQMDVPQPFLHWIDTSFWLWFIRAVLAAGFTACLLYACTAPGGRHSRDFGQENPPARQTRGEKEKK